MANSYIPQTVIDEVVEIARTYLRDFAKFFQVSFSGTGRTYELGHPNIDPDTLWIAVYSAGSPTELAASAFNLDARNGLIRLTSTPANNTTVMVEGYYYEWVLPTDLNFYSRRAIQTHIYNTDIDVENMAQVVIDVIGMAAIIESLWALMTEYSRDIDVMTSESVHIPGSQRFRMVQGLLEYWMREYDNRAKALNIGINRIEVMNLRRVSRTTNRYVPIYKPREIGDYGPITRVFPEIDSGTIAIEEVEENLREDVYVDVPPPASQYTSGVL
jgi:hypothetical protein